MEVKIKPARGAGMSALRLVIREPDTGARVRSFAMVHERPLHLFIVSRALDYFAHVHPDPAGPGVFNLAHEAPPGEYMLIADFLPHGGTTQTVQRAIVTPGYTGPVMARVPVPPVGPAERIVDGVRIRLEARNLAPRKNASLQFTVSNAETGEPVHDLEPFLGAPAHMLLVAADLTEAIHGHPEDQGSQPMVTFEPLIPTAGTYKLWVQFQRKGTVITAPFVIQVTER
jgi:Cu+-exporting ATPase